MATGAHDHALVVGADVMSSIIDYKDRSTCVLFGDGAGAVVVSAAGRRRRRRSSISSTRSTAAAAPRSACPAGGSRQPPSHETVDQRLHYVKQDGRDGLQVRGAQDRGNRAAHSRAQRPDSRPTSTCSCRTRPTAGSSSRRPRSSGVDPDKVIINIERFGNTTAATIPLALNDAVLLGPAEEGRSRAAGVGRRRVHRRRRPAALGVLIHGGRVFLLSPANCGGRRAAQVLSRCLVPPLAARCVRR